MRRDGKKAATHKMNPRRKKNMPRHLQERHRARIEEEYDREIENHFSDNMLESGAANREYD